MSVFCRRKRDGNGVRRKGSEKRMLFGEGFCFEFSEEGVEGGEIFTEEEEVGGEDDDGGDAGEELAKLCLYARIEE